MQRCHRLLTSSLDQFNLDLINETEEVAHVTERTSEDFWILVRSSEVGLQSCTRVSM